MAFDIPKKADVDVADKVAKDKKAKEEALARAERRRFSENMLENRCKNIFLNSYACESGQVSTILHPCIFEFLELLEEFREKIEDAGWNTGMIYATENDASTYLVIFGRKLRENWD